MFFGKDTRVAGELDIVALQRELPFVDLHGCTSENFSWDLDLALFREKERYLRVIFGHGSGILRKAVLLHLQDLAERDRPFLRGVMLESHGGSCIVAL